MSREFTVAAVDIRLRGVDSLGDGPPLLFLNGGFSTRRQWNRVIDRLGGGYRTVTFDGRTSGGPGTPAEYAVRDAIDDVDRVIEATVLRRPILVGWSHGATIAVCYAAEYPEVVGGLVLVDGACPVSVLDEAGKDGVREAFRRSGRLTRVTARLGGAPGLSPRQRAEAVIATDEVNGQLAADFASLRCPTAFVVGSGGHPEASRERTRMLRAAARAEADNAQVTVFATTTAGRPAHVLARDADLVAAAIHEVARRTTRLAVR
ncbi:2-(acetamidomethylene)succinate hydrolase [Streptomyces hundungensis]|uniref:2-(Acetamidomethylene)succinate hydrolase n=1 Tax=Streptomyces hundungensis TaxID=1077946 RepID=A0A387HCN9_9ACTN|nr:alpha/beta fold hydrolase [Streptomyces hundungensis]AYG78522.1 2-(acetamidomethylene)succinate hydrolase [Streptomyces hundungensis]